jgi:type IV pilus assembly protein PilC
LDKVFKRLSDTFERDTKLNQKVKSAMTYPIVVLVVAVAVVFILMTFVVPTFADVLSSLDSELPIYTKILLKIGNIFKNFGAIYYYLSVGIIRKGLLQSKPGKRLIGKI